MVSAADALAVARAAGGDDRVVVVTLGAAGVVAAGPDTTVARQAVAVDVVDTTGAGDCFAGVLAASVAATLGLEAAVDRANRAAARAVTRLGTVAAMPTAEELSQRRSG